MKINTESEALAYLKDHREHHAAEVGTLRFVWQTGPYYCFLERTSTGRTVWSVGPRGGIDVQLSIQDWQWDLLR